MFLQESLVRKNPCGCACIAAKIERLGAVNGLPLVSYWDDWLVPHQAINLDASRIEKVARFLTKIGSTLAISSAGIVSALGGAVAGDFELQHVEEIRFGINSTMWEKNSILLKSFVETLAQRATK